MLQKYQLRNGQKVILWPTKKAPVVTIQAWVRTGSADERKGEEGISHFIEHLLFKGTRKYGVGEIASIVEASGGELNAYTSFDQTVFHITISKKYLDVALDCLYEMMGHPKFDAAEIDNEREVVIEEIKRSNDSPHRAASRLLFETIYKKHPYGVPVIGYDSNIKGVSRKTLVDYYNSRYVPKNMSLVVVGDFEEKELKGKIQGTFGKIPTYKLRKTKRVPEPKQKDERIHVQKTPFQETIIHAAWRVPGARHKDTPALDLLAMILGQGDSSRLTQKVRIENPVVNWVGAHVYSPSDEGFFGLSCGLKTENVKEYLDHLGEEILRIQNECPSEEEMKKAISILEADEVYGVETVDGLARKLGNFDFLFNKPEYYKEYLDRLINTTPQEISEVARKYIKPETLSVASVINEKDKDITKDLEKWAFDLALAQDAFRKVKLEKTKSSHKKAKVFTKSLGVETPEIQKLNVGAGSKMILAPNYQAPTCSVKVGMRGGLRIEPNGQEGITELLSSVWLAGTRSRPESAILKRLDELAIAIRPMAGKNSASLSLTTLSQNLDEALELFSEILVQPVFEEAAVERELDVLKEYIKQKRDNPAYLAFQQFSEKMFPGHPTARDSGGTESSLKKITRNDVKDNWMSITNQNNLTIVAAGDFDPKKMSLHFNKLVSGLAKGGEFDKKTAPVDLKQDEYVYENLKKEQSHIVYGYRGLNMYDPRRFALAIMDSVLAGQGGRLFLELRDKASLAYSVSPARQEGIESGYFGAYIGCSPEKGKKAIEMMEVEFEKLKQDKISQAELERAQRYLIGRHDIGLQKNSSMANAILFEEIYDQSYMNVLNFSRQIQSVTTEQVLSLAQEIFSGHKVVVCVGPEKAF